MFSNFRNWPLKLLKIQFLFQSHKTFYCFVSMIFVSQILLFGLFNNFSDYFYLQQKSKHRNIVLLGMKTLSSVQTSKNIFSTQDISPRSYLSIKKQKVRLHYRPDKQANAKYKEVFEDLGQPKNQFIKKRIKQFSINFTNQVHRKFDSPNKSSVIYSTVDSQSPFTTKNISRAIALRSYSEKKKLYFERAHTINQQQKLERLITRKSQQEQDFQIISNRIHLKVAPKKLKIRFDPLKKIAQSSWYDSWSKSTRQSERRKKKHIALRLKTTDAKRRKTYDFLNTQEYH